MNHRAYQICAHCIMDTSDSSIAFDERGWCVYCNNFQNNILPSWHTDERGRQKLLDAVEKIKARSKGKDFDCIIGLSGGLDSSYLTYIAKEELGLRPLLFHVDAGWNTDQAVGNIEKLVDGLGLDLYTEVINWEEIKDLQVSLLKSQIPHQDIAQDTAFFSTLYKFARENRIKHVLTGGNYSTECCREPEEWGAYPGTDKTLILDIHSKFGKIPLETFPIVDVFTSKIYYKYILGMQVFKPLDLIPYIKKDAESLLEKRFGWKKFKHKHHESRFTRFFEDYWLPRKFGFDRRKAHFSSLILTGQMTRQEALARIANPELDEHFLECEFEYVAHKLDLTVAELREIFNGENKSSYDYKSKRALIELGSKAMRLLGLEKRLYK
ncbi:MAG: N-acetyl sugar amidotransferase [Sulfuritalea sp.]|nr:N-acetyl sugar amidotransferase [Sulfuritalea sp.]